MFSKLIQSENLKILIFTLGVQEDYHNNSNSRLWIQIMSRQETNGQTQLQILKDDFESYQKTDKTRLQIDDIFYNKPDPPPDWTNLLIIRWTQQHPRFGDSSSQSRKQIQYIP